MGDFAPPPPHQKKTKSKKSICVLDLVPHDAPPHTHTYTNGTWSLNCVQKVVCIFLQPTQKTNLHSFALPFWLRYLKVPSPIIQYWGFICMVRIFTPHMWIWISVKSVKSFGCTKQFSKLQPPILYCASLIMVTITGHTFTAIFPREYLLAIKFLVGNEKNMGNLLIPKRQNLKKFKKKLEK